MSAHRHKSRQFALQMLFEWDMARNDPQLMKKRFWRTPAPHYAVDTMAFANKLFDGTVENAAEIDALVASLSSNWRMDRLAPVDRNILRLAIHEIREADPDVPPKVAIDEALELAKEFSSEESPAFLNGVLDAARKKLHAESSN